MLCSTMESQKERTGVMRKIKDNPRKLTNEQVDEILLNNGYGLYLRKLPNNKWRGAVVEPDGHIWPSNKDTVFEHAVNLLYRYAETVIMDRKLALPGAGVATVPSSKN